jgi:hypothetical protein
LSNKGKAPPVPSNKTVYSHSVVTTDAVILEESLVNWADCPVLYITSEQTNEKQHRFHRLSENVGMDIDVIQEALLEFICSLCSLYIAQTGQF